MISQTKAQSHGYAKEQLVEANRYKTRGSGFDSFSIIALGSTQVLTEMITSHISWEVTVASE